MNHVDPLLLWGSESHSASIADFQAPSSLSLHTIYTHTCTRKHQLLRPPLSCKGPANFRHPLSPNSSSVFTASYGKSDTRANFERARAGKRTILPVALSALLKGVQNCECVANRKRRGNHDAVVEPAVVLLPSCIDASRTHLCNR